jgi:hypothetical protein
MGRTLSSGVEGEIRVSREIFVSEPWEIQVDSKGVRITYRSDDKVFIRRMSRADYRVGLENSLCQLNEYERTEARKVTPLRGRRREH